MRLLFVSQLFVAVIGVLVIGLLNLWPNALAFAYGTSLGLIMTVLTRRSADRALSAAVENPGRGLIAMYSGFALRYAVAILGLMTGFRVLGLPAEPMIGGFILMIIVQVLVSVLISPPNEKREA
jgi:F0F1-type ATP synthase assembly protein I